MDRFPLRSLLVAERLAGRAFAIARFAIVAACAGALASARGPLAF